MRAADTIELSAAGNDFNTRRVVRVERRVHTWLGWLAAVFIALGLSYALICFATPCEGASLCMAAVLPTQRSWLQRLVLDFQAWRLRSAIRSARHELASQYEHLEMAQWECEHLPLQLNVTRGHIDNLVHQLSLVEGTAEA